MKNLVKLIINSDKIMKSEELLLLRGGYDTVRCSADDCNGDSDCPTQCPSCTEQIGKNKRCTTP
jgi:hypothetical protein